MVSKNIIGQTLECIGLILIFMIYGSDNSYKGLAFGILAIIIGGSGYILIRYDVAKEEYERDSTIKDPSKTNKKSGQ